MGKQLQLQQQLQWQLPLLKLEGKRAY